MQQPASRAFNTLAGSHAQLDSRGEVRGDTNLTGIDNLLEEVISLEKDHAEARRQLMTTDEQRHHTIDRKYSGDLGHEGMS